MATLGLSARRLAASLVDAAVALLLALLCAPSVGGWFAARAVVALRIGQPETLWRGPLPLILGVLGEVVYALPLTLVAVSLAEPVTGLTPGKLALRVAAGARAGARRARRSAGCRAGYRDADRAALWRRFALRSAAPLGWLIGLVAGSWLVMLAGSVAGVLFALGCGLALRTGGEVALHDRLAGSLVRRCKALPAQPRRGFAVSTLQDAGERPGPPRELGRAGARGARGGG